MSESVNSISPPRSGQRSGGVARQGRRGAVRRTAGKPRWFAGSLRSRPLPPSGYSPSRAGGVIQIQVPLPLRSCPRASTGLLPHGAASEVGEWPVRAEGARSAGPQGNHGGLLARFARAPSPLRGTPPAELGEKSRGRRGDGRA